MSADTKTTRPIPPEFRTSQRVRYSVNVSFEDAGTYVGYGWALLDGAWLHVIDDENCCWQTWPARHVHWVEWIDEEPRA